jgi:aldose sugar dehydrogenase
MPRLPCSPATLSVIACASLALAAPASAAEARDPARIVTELCATCHNQNLVGSPAPNLVDGLWTHGGSDENILKSIREGFPQSGMPPFDGLMTADETSALLGYMRDLGRKYAAGEIKHPTPPASISLKSERHNFRLETYVPDLATPWGLALLPDGAMLVTEREGTLRLVRNGKSTEIRGTPKVFCKQDGGMLDVIAHPDYARNGWVYLAFSEAGATPEVSMTVVVRGRLRDGQWTDQQQIFRAPPERYYAGWIHYGCRFLFDREGHLFFTIGDRGKADDAQDFASPCGKIHRVFDDGRIPPDNPFAKRAGAWPSIWSMGNRHVQGLQFHPVTGKMWATEHGPTGGDELNRIDGGRNYGWPIISKGTDRRMQFAAAREGLESPLAFWSPSVAPSGIEFYTGDKFPQWKNSLFIACLGGEQLKRIETDGDRVVHQEIVFKGMGRVRDVVTGPDGFIYLALNAPGRIARLVPDETK